MSTVPTIDIGPFLRSDAAGKRVVGEQVARTCEETGFLVISGHGFPLELLGRAQRELFAFFDLPAETKNRWHPTGPSKQRGYHGFATRGLAYTLGEQTPPDLRESVFLGPVDDHRAYYAGLPEAATSYAPNLIPDVLEPTLIALYREYERLARDMMRIFAAALVPGIGGLAALLFALRGDWLGRLLARVAHATGLERYAPTRRLVERARGLAPMAEQVLDGRQPLPHGVDVDPEALRGDLGVLVAVEVGQQRAREFRAALVVVGDQRANGRLEKRRQARLVVGLEQRGIDGQFVLADDLAERLGAPAPVEGLVGSRRAQRGSLVSGDVRHPCGRESYAVHPPSIWALPRPPGTSGSDQAVPRHPTIIA